MRIGIRPELAGLTCLAGAKFTLEATFEGAEFCLEVLAGLTCFGGAKFTLEATLEGAEFCLDPTLDLLLGAAFCLELLTTLGGAKFCLVCDGILGGDAFLLGAVF
jgi:hypothetical protein